MDLSYIRCNNICYILTKKESVVKICDLG